MRAHQSATAQAVSAIAWLLTTTFAGTALAQQRPGPVMEFATGSLLFADDGVVKEQLLGGAARVYLTPRLAVGPEIGFILGQNHSHLMLTGNITFDVLAPVNGLPRRVTPFLVAGGGLFRTRETFFNGPYVHNEGAFTAGGGARVRIGDSVFAGVEARLGWEPHLRLNAMVGVRLGD